MSDFFERQEANLKRLREVSRLNVYGEPETPLPCDNVQEWKGAESCNLCPKQCKIHEQPDRSNSNE